jgi:integrase
VKAWRAAHHWHPHRLRHAAATAFRRAGDLDAARIILDHGSEAMTEGYAEADHRKADALVSKIG